MLRNGDLIKFHPIRALARRKPDTQLQQLYILPKTDRGIVKSLQAFTDEEYNDTK
jgi:hypothetical protein